MAMVVKGEIGAGLAFRVAFMQVRTDWYVSCPTTLFGVCSGCKQECLVRRWSDVLETPDAGGGLVCRGCYLRDQQRGCGDGAAINTDAGADARSGGRDVPAT